MLTTWKRHLNWTTVERLPSMHMQALSKSVYWRKEKAGDCANTRRTNSALVLRKISVHVIVETNMCFIEGCINVETSWAENPVPSNCKQILADFLTDFIFMLQNIFMQPAQLVVTYVLRHSGVNFLPLQSSRLVKKAQKTRDIKTGTATALIRNEFSGLKTITWAIERYWFLHTKVLHKWWVRSRQLHSLQRSLSIKSFSFWKFIAIPLWFWKISFTKLYRAVHSCAFSRRTRGMLPNEQQTAELTSCKLLQQSAEPKNHFFATSADIFILR